MRQHSHLMTRKMVSIGSAKSPGAPPQAIYQACSSQVSIMLCSELNSSLLHLGCAGCTHQNGGKEKSTSSAGSMEQWRGGALQEPKTAGKRV